jgi:hypothetical protein
MVSVDPEAHGRRALDAKRKPKNAKKKAEKRRRQKEEK